MKKVQKFITKPFNSYQNTNKTLLNLLENQHKCL